MNIEEIRKELAESADEKYRTFQAALIPGVEHFLGVRRPVLRKLAARILKEDGRQFLREASGETHEELQLKALVIGGLSGDLEGILALAKAYVPEITDWSLCDTFCHELKLVKRERDAFWPLVLEYAGSEKEFEARTAAVMLLEHYICGEWIGRTLEALFSIHQEGYYAQMAVAWAYSICYVKFPEETGRFLAEHELPEFTYRKTISKICDSLVVSKEEKKRLRQEGFRGQPVKETNRL